VTREAIRFLRYAWAAPCTAVGLVAALFMFLAGGRARTHAGVLEVALSQSGGRPRRGFGAITFGHVVLGRSEQLLGELRAHELQHVRQYERWGPVFFLAYPASSLYQLLRGRNPYWHNYFEVQCRQLCGD
jgi:hypothetical protein